jgi:uncharacterized membrane protein
VWAYAAAWTTVLGTITSLRAWALFSGGFDLGFFIQASHVGGNTILPMAGFTLLEDHFSPLLIALAPVLDLLPVPYGLIWLQTVAVGVSIPLVWRLSRRNAPPERWSWLLVVAYSMAPPVLGAVWFDFHPTLLAAPLLLWFANAITAGNSTAIPAGILAATTREDIALVVFVIAILYRRRMPRPLAAVAVTSGSLLVLGQIVMTNTWFIDTSFAYVDWSAPVATLRSSVAFLWADGSFLLLVPALVLPWPWLIGRKPDWRPILAAAVLVVPLLLAANPNTKEAGYHYYFPAVLLITWSVAGAAPIRFTGSRARLALAATGTAVILGPMGSSALTPVQPATTTIVYRSIAESTDIAAAHDLLACIPSGAAISVSSPLQPFVADRRAAYIWPHPFEDLITVTGLSPLVVRTDISPDFVIAHTGELPRNALDGSRFPDLAARGYQGLASTEWFELWGIGEAAPDC